MKKKFLFYLFLILLITSLLTSILVGGYSRYQLKNILESRKQDLFSQIKSNCVIFDKLLFNIEKKMTRDSEKALLPIVNELKNKDIRESLTSKGLKKLAVKYGVNEIYLINKKGIIFNTSFKPDMNFNLFSIGEDFSRFLKSVYGKGEIFKQRLGISNKTGIINMYMYYSPEGTDYIIEISVRLKDYVAANYSSSYYNLIFKDLFGSLIKNNKCLINLEIYRVTDVAGWSLINEGKRFDKSRDLISKIKKENEVRIINGDMVTIYTVLYMDELGFDFVKELYIEEKYDFSVLNIFLKRIISAILVLSFVILIFIFIVSSGIFNSYLIKPIMKINEGLKKISDGNYNIVITLKNRDELSKIAGNITEMSEKIKVRMKEIKESEEKYRKLIESANDAVMVADADTGILIDANKKAEELLGLPVDKIIGMHQTEIHPKEEREYYKELFLKLLETGHSVEHEVHINNNKGEKIPVEISASVTEYAGNKIVQGVFRDMRERKKAETKLRKERDFSNTLIQVMPIYFNAISADGEVLLMNETMLKVLGYRLDEVRGADYLKDFICEDERGKVAEVFDKIMNTKDFTVNQNYVLTRDGEKRLVEWRGRPVFKESGELDFLIGVGLDITERKKTEDELRESRRMYRAIFETTGTSTVIIEEDTTLSLVNAEFEKLSGYRKEEIEGKKRWTEFVVKEDLERMKNYHDSRRAEDSNTPTQYRFRFKDRYGKIKDIFLNIAMIPGTKKSVASLLDITTMQETERSLQKSEKRFRQVVTNAQEWIWEVDPDGLYTYSNQVVEKILGYRPEEIVGKKYFYEFFCPDNYEKVKKDMFRFISNKESFKKYINCRVHKNGKPVWFSTSGVPVLREDGELIGYMGTDTDITERLLAEEALRESEEEFRLAFENANDAIIWADPYTGNITRCNRAAEKLLERDREEIIGSHQTSLHPPEKREYYISFFKKHFELNGVIDEEAEVITKSGKIKPVYVSASVTLIKDKPVMQGIFRDISERKKMEEHLRQSQKLEAVGQISAGIAHQLNTPLAVISTRLQTLMDDLKKSKSLSYQVEKIENAVRNIDKIAGIITSLLSFARHTEIKKESIDIFSVIEEILDFIEIKAKEKSIEIKFEKTEDIPLIKGDKDKLQQVFLNIAVNAFDSMPEGGVLTVTAGITFRNKEKYVLAEFKDTGKGMSKEVLSNIFIPFFTTKPAGEGTGLGMAVSYGIIKEHNGDIIIKSKKGKGSSFKVILPV